MERHCRKDGVTKALPAACFVLLLALSGCAAANDQKPAPRILLKPSEAALPEEKSGVIFNALEKSVSYGVGF